MDSKIKVAIEKVNSKNPMEGILMLKEIAKEYPNNTTPLFHLGMFSIQTNQFEKAINYFTNVLNIDSNKIEAHLHLGDVFLQIGDTVKAINELQRYIAKETDQSKVDEANILVNKLN